MNWKAVLLPLRFVQKTSTVALAKEARIEKIADDLSKVSVLGQDLVFYWAGPVGSNLHFSIDQEFNPEFPHHYTTPPITLTKQSLVLDVGACEGLFAFRALRQNLAARVICFEPFEKNVKYARLAAAENGLQDRVLVEPMAVGRTSGKVSLESGGTPDGNRVLNASTGNGPLVDCVSLDDYCAARNLNLTKRDLIKIDAEGSDLDVLMGAERLLRQAAPQIAVTTYHKPEHPIQIVDYLKSVQPAYQLRLKGFSFWTPEPVPVLLQAAIRDR